MRNFVNPSFTIHFRHQVLRGLAEKGSTFQELNFFEGTFGQDKFAGFSLVDKNGLGKHLLPLKVSQYPIRLPENKCLLRKRRIGKANVWFRIRKFLKHKETGHVYCEGDLFKFSTRHPVHPYVGLRRLVLQTANLYVLYSQLHPANDFMLQCKNEGFVPEIPVQSNPIDYWLLNWIN